MNTFKKPAFSFYTELLPKETKILKILDVDYARIKSRDGGDIYLTKYAVHMIDAIKPENWYFGNRENWERLSGSGTIYRIHNKRLNKGKTDFVVKWCRVGQDVPGRDPDSLDDFATGEFNSPFEEFSLLMEMRDTRYESKGSILTHKPLVIYVPAERINPDNTGRRSYKFEDKAKNLDIELDLYRSYILIYEWVKGIDAVEASEKIGISNGELKDITLKVENDIIQKGFKDYDRKPNHIIVRTSGSNLVKKNNRPIYAYIDFEMLQRTPEREKIVKESKRHNYLIRQKDRFNPGYSAVMPPHLSLVNILGVDYIYGKVESTGGLLWVVGKDPELFDYFLPERWRRTPRTKLLHGAEMYHTTTKDAIHIVWKVSHVGEKPVFFEQNEINQKIVDCGYNSPFEEFALALDLGKKDIPTKYPRAIYRTGYESSASEYISDNKRYESHKNIIMPDGNPVLQRNYNYIVISGYWNGPDELLAVRDGEYYSGINILHARNEKIISEQTFRELIERENAKLIKAGVEDLNLRADKFIISLDHLGKLILDSEGKPEVRCCNFELLRKIRTNQNAAI